MKTLLVLSCVGALGLAGCASAPDDTAVVSIGSPPGGIAGADPTTFRTSVSRVFERRCGSLDCHGQLARGLRIYSSNGLRLPNDAGAAPGAGTATPDEINANYASIVGLQPEKINEFLAKSPRTADDAYQLVVLSKPLELEKHKGGSALTKGEPAEQCIISWLVGTRVDPVLCAAGAKPL